MPITSADVKYRLSGGAGNADPNASLGGAKSSTDVTDASDDNLFDDISRAEHIPGRVEYRALYVHNAHGSLTLLSAVVWISSDFIGVDSDLSIAVGSAAVGGIEQTIADETTAPSGVSWSDAAVSRATGLPLGDLPAGQHRAVWLRRTISPGTAPQPADSCAIQAGGDTF
jgi:hypothetical protein